MAVIGFNEQVLSFISFDTWQGEIDKNDDCYLYINETYFNERNRTFKDKSILILIEDLFH